MSNEAEDMYFCPDVYNLKMRKLIIFINHKNSPYPDELDYIENRCTMDDIYQLKKIIKMSFYIRIIISIILIFIIAFICLFLAYHVKSLYNIHTVVVDCVILLIIILGLTLLIGIINTPLISKTKFQAINKRLCSKGLAFIIPHGKDKFFRHKYFELWKIEELAKESKKKAKFIELQNISSQQSQKSNNHSESIKMANVEQIQISIQQNHNSNNQSQSLYITEMKEIHISLD